MQVNGSRLSLIATTLEHLDAELHAGSAALSALLAAEVPASWPPGEYDRDALTFFDEQLTVGGAAAVGWYGWYAVADGALVGAGGFFGPPDADGMVEIGYSVAPEHRGLGYATELVTLLVGRARADARVRTVQAHTTPSNVASVRVLERAGLQLAQSGVGEAGEQVRYSCHG